MKNTVTLWYVPGEGLYDQYPGQLCSEFPRGTLIRKGNGEVWSSSGLVTRLVPYEYSTRWWGLGLCE